jgi:hypothetical protein
VEKDSEEYAAKAPQRQANRISIYKDVLSKSGIDQPVPVSDAAAASMFSCYENLTFVDIAIKKKGPQFGNSHSRA